MYQRSKFLLFVCLMLAALTNGLAFADTSSDKQIVLDVYKSPSCGCCGKWVEHLENDAFKTAVHHPDDLQGLKLKRGIAADYQSCHTGVSSQGYVFEGHVPARYIRKFLDNPPQNAIGLSVPGMPVGSPGMEVGDRFMPYQVLLLMKDGSSAIFASVDSPDQQ